MYNVDRPHTIDGLNRIASAGFTYDTRGNLTNDGTNAYTYTAENLLKTAPGSTTLAYDPLGRLYQTVKSPTTTRFLYDGIDMIGEYDAANAVQRRYVHGPGIDNPIVWYEGSAISNATRRFLMADERGSVVSVTDSTGATVGLNSYDEYGIPASGNVGRFGYTGQAWLPEAKLWYYKARIYSPGLGRFLQTDPIGYRDGMNWYNYVGSDPVNFVDPLGLCTQLVGGEGPDGGAPYPPENCPKEGFQSPLLEMEFRMLDFYNVGQKTVPHGRPSVAKVICGLGWAGETLGELAEDNMLEAAVAGAAVGAMAGGPGSTATAPGGAVAGLAMAGAVTEVGTAGQFVQDMVTARSPRDVGVAAFRAGTGSVGRLGRGAANAISKVGHYLDSETLKNVNTVFDAVVDGAFSAVTGQAFDPESQC